MTRLFQRPLVVLTIAVAVLAAIVAGSWWAGRRFRQEVVDQRPIVANTPIIMRTGYITDSTIADKVETDGERLDSVVSVLRNHGITLARVQRAQRDTSRFFYRVLKNHAEAIARLR